MLQFPYLITGCTNLKMIIYIWQAYKFHTMLFFNGGKRISSRMLFVLFLLLQTAVFFSCEKSEGRGGTGSIYGIVMEQFYNDDYSDLLYEKPAVDEEIFVLYGDNGEVGSSTETAMNGEFRFKYLYPGSYTVYFQTEDSTAAFGEDTEKVVQVDLAKGEDLDLGELVKLSSLDYNDGAASIRGVVRVVKYDKDSMWPNLVIEYSDYAYEQEVYLTYGNHTFYDKRIRTQHDGSFEFSGLIPGRYLIVLYTEDVTRVKGRVPVKFEVSITEMDDLVDLGEITIEKI